MESNVVNNATSNAKSLFCEQSAAANSVTPIKWSPAAEIQEGRVQLKESPSIQEECKNGFQNLRVLDDSTDIPKFVKDHYTTLTFPEKLMLMLTHVERECAKKGINEKEESVGWILDGKAFAIRSKERFTKTWLPLFFVEAKFSSFTRKLYRWEFRKAGFSPVVSNSEEQYFGNENFQRNNIDLLSRMRSVTAQKVRNEATIVENGTMPGVQSSPSQYSWTGNLPNMQNPQHLQILQNGFLPIIPKAITTEQLIKIQQAIANLQNLISIIIQQQQVAQLQQLRNHAALQSQQQAPVQIENCHQVQFQQRSQSLASPNLSQQPELGISQQPGGHQSTQLSILMNQLLLQLGQVSTPKAQVSILVAQPTQNIPTLSNCSQIQCQQHLDGTMPVLSQPSQPSGSHSNHSGNQESAINAMELLSRRNRSGQSQAEPTSTPQLLQSQAPLIQQQHEEIQPDEPSQSANQNTEPPNQQQPPNQLVEILQRFSQNGPPTSFQIVEGANQQEQLKGILEILQRYSQSGPSLQTAPHP